MAADDVPLKKALPNKQTWLWYAGGGVVAVGFYLHYKRKSAASAATVDTSGAAGVDPNLYGAGYSAASGGASGITPSAYSYTDPSTGAVIGNGSGFGITSPSTNAAWFQQSNAYLAGLGYDPLTSSAALGQYLFGANLTPSQLAIVQTALGAEGYPPNQPIAPHTAPAGGQTGTVAPPGRINTGGVQNRKGINQFVVEGNLDAAQSLRNVARDLLPSSQRGDANAVEAMLQRLIAANPGLKGKTTAPGGHILAVPANATLKG